ncbi:hypothetical protein C0989_012190 [Termitomyces sp. Mn162]|nr:hypothetical protein C0989_012190 [Termitomyces sp. Mn162]
MTPTDVHNTSSHSSLYTAIIFDLGDVLFTWSLSSNPPLPEKLLRRILSCSHWFEYEKGNINEAEVYSRVAKDFLVDPAAVKDTLQVAQDSLQSNTKMLEVIQELKEAGLMIYAMSNISAPSWEILERKATPSQWALFDHVFTSASAHQRKPNLGFFRHVIERTGIDPSRTILVDDKLENVLTARSFGMHGIIFDNESKVIKDLKNLCYDPVLRGKRFLTSHKKNLKTVTSNGIEFMDDYSQLIILLATGDDSLVDYVKSPGQFNVFPDGTLFTTEVYPNDLDTTAIGLTVTEHVDVGTKHKIMDEMLEYRDSDAIIQVYFDHSRPRIDPVICINVLNLFYENGRGHELPETLDWVEQVLRHRAYISGTTYYIGADVFLFFLSRLLQTSAEVRRRLGSIFKERVIERFGVEGDSLSLSARIIAATVAGVIDERALKNLLSMQCEDGSWDDSWFWRWGMSPIMAKNDGVTTALAIWAIEQVQSLRKEQSEANGCTQNALPRNQAGIGHIQSWLDRGTVRGPKIPQITEEWEYADCAWEMMESITTTPKLYLR